MTRKYPEMQGRLITVETLYDDMTRLGIKAGMTLIVHSSMKALGGWMPGGPVDVILALEQALGEEGTLVMPTHTGGLSDPGGWSMPPVPQSWWEPIRRTMPAYDPDLSPTRLMGAIPECFRKQRGVIRSSHPQVSFAAWGKGAAGITGEHSLDYGLGERSPLARLYDADGWVLLLGVGHGNNTSLHLAEIRAEYPGKKDLTVKAPIHRNGVREWASFRELDYDSDDFEEIGRSFAQDTGLVIRGHIAGAEVLLMPQKALVDYGVNWMESIRQAPDDDEAMQDG
ncbi:aminoglycoside N(3)-acetyltransferase [Paenibacillus ginsengarvi]|nr:AAC(3) family N-acetyltransferase [Paenibacillus ginsengarvi]